jgi:ribosome maturation factor RimP
MAKDTSVLQALIEPAVTALGHELLGCIYMPQGGQGLLRVYIDNPNGITVEDCAKASRQISAILDVEDPITGAYDLEVSSPGLNRPLFTLAHFQRAIGAMAKVRLHVPLDKRRQFRGQIQAVVDDKIVLKMEDEQIFELPMANIAKAHLLIDASVKD